MSEIVLLDMEDLEFAHSVVFDRFKDDPEPMPDWREADRTLLETCQGCTETGAREEQKYPTLIEKTAKFFYSAIKLHIFPNGNKRFGLAATIVFLVYNDMQVNALYEGELAIVAEWVADTDPHQPETSSERIIEALTRFFQERVGPLDLNEIGPPLLEET